MTPIEATALWYKALASEIGVSIESDPKNTEAFLTILYTARREAKDPALDAISIVLPGGKSEIFLYKRGTNPDA